MFTVSGGFIGMFKLGDNIQYNLEILKYLYREQTSASPSDAHLLRKPIIVLLGSVCEAVLYDLHLRMRTYTIEGVSGIAYSVLAYVRGKRIDKFEHYISSTKKHSLLGPKNDGIYDDLEELRKLRNRIHIQNEKRHFEPDESDAFSKKRQDVAEQASEKLLKHVSANHPRPATTQGYVKDFELPWGEHYSKIPVVM
jgi:hypothetical protein